MMKYHCHCGFEEQLRKFKARKLGAFGVVLFVLHLFYHVAECLILPAILVGLGQQLPAQLSSSRQVILSQTERLLTSFERRHLLSPHVDDFRLYNIHGLPGVVPGHCPETICNKNTLALATQPTVLSRHDIGPKPLRP